MPSNRQGSYSRKKGPTTVSLDLNKDGEASGEKKKQVKFYEESTEQEEEPLLCKDEFTGLHSVTCDVLVVAKEVRRRGKGEAKNEIHEVPNEAVVPEVLDLPDEVHKNHACHRMSCAREETAEP